MIEYVGDEAAALQRYLNERRSLAEASLSMDAYERWGHGCDPGFEARFAALGDVEGRKRQLVEAFGAGVRALRETKPEAVVALAQAHQALLQRCIEAAGADSTEASVARDEIAAWKAVEAGEADTVTQNCYYIRYPHGLFEAYFGFRPGWPISP